MEPTLIIEPIPNTRFEESSLIEKVAIFNKAKVNVPVDDLLHFSLKDALNISEGFAWLYVEVRKQGKLSTQREKKRSDLTELSANQNKPEKF